MIHGIHHIAIICSHERSLTFYHALGFQTVSRVSRPEHHDQIVMLSGYGVTLELFIDPTHPTHVTNPEAYGLRHLALQVTNIEQVVDTLKEYHPEPIRLDSFTGDKMTFVKDPDGLPIELHE